MGPVTPLFYNFCLVTGACSKKPFYQAGGPDKEGSVGGNLIFERESVFSCRDEKDSKSFSVRKLSRDQKSIKNNLETNQIMDRICLLLKCYVKLHWKQ